MSTETSMCQSSRLLSRTSEGLQLGSNWIFSSSCDKERDTDTPLPSTQPTRSKKPDEKTPTRPRVTQSTGKIVMNIFWDCKDVLLVDFLLHGITINGSYYASLLHRLRSSIREKLMRDVLLLHDKAPVHKSNVT